MAHVYDEALPVDPDWVKERVDQEVTIRYLMGLEDLIDVDGIEGMNDYLDEVTGVILNDISYRIGTPDVDDDLGDQTLLIEATGILVEGTA